MTEIWELEEIKNYKCPKCGRSDPYNSNICSYCLVWYNIRVKMVKKEDIEKNHIETTHCEDHDPTDTLCWLYAKYGYDYF